MKWERIHPLHREYARNLREAFGPAVKLYLSGNWKSRDIRTVGLTGFERAFHRKITPRHFSRLWKLVLGRTQGNADRFRNVESYLPRSIRSAKRKRGTKRHDLQRLETAISAVEDPSGLTPTQTNLIWDSACTEIRELQEIGLTFKQAKRRVIDALVNSGLDLSRSESALRRQVSRKFDRWAKNGSVPKAIRDNRRHRLRGGILSQMSDQDLNKLTAHSLQGGLAGAWRNCLQSCLLSPAILKRYDFEPANKSYVPQAIRDRLGPDIEALTDYHRGPKQARLRGAFISRDWSDVAAGDWYQADDTTLPIYYWEKGDGGRVRILRGQCLVMIDCRSLRILSFALHSERNYNATVIRGLILRTHDKYGLPRRGFYFENGIWKSARILKGTNSSDQVPAEETELGLREHGLIFRHARPGNARAKLVEGVLGILQRHMESELGYCGRNERTEKFERLQKARLDAEAGRIEAGSAFLHRDQWVERLARVCESYNEERQDGRLLQGLSPREGWEEHFGTVPLVRLDAQNRYLLANHRRPAKVTRNGICIRLGKVSHYFRNEITGGLIGREVQAYFNPEDLESIFVMESLGAGVAHVVEAAPVIPAMSASPEQLQEAAESCASHNRPMQTRYQEIAQHFPKDGRSYFRPVLTDPETAEIGEEIAADQELVRRRKNEAAAKSRELARLRRQFGAGPQLAGVTESRQLMALKMRAEAEKLRTEELASQSESGERDAD